ncbi:sulfatase-like hydrolase/transferase [Maribellus comscasis]|uniref:Sulfatase-like hydrolase/transferase n=1 Tax=Maribellus comscasis TaxID=2681766 RepID=A0A6I6K042_9BACT|nr:sulfatase-like hydrolase/transferase [Maribellus comscasis]QGY46798.1 sulfatase-like hydrolase/transferase [Maribellus comscasis]
MKNYFLLYILVFFVFNSSCREETPLPNIVIFLADDLGYGDLGCYGNPIIKTPNIDKLAAEGVRMTDFHSGGTVCSPSRAALLTGRNPYRSGFFYILGKDTYLKNEEITIAELLKKTGYETSFFGKWHLSTLEKEKRDEPGPGDQGFDYWMGTTVNAFDGPKNPGKFILNGKSIGVTEGWYCDIIVDKACNWLENVRNKKKPFFMYMCSHEPHTPILPPEKYSQMYDTGEVDELEKNIKYGQVTRPKKDISLNKKEYYGTVSQLDNAFGRLLNTLEELDLKENTLVIFTSDNGPETPVTIEESLGNWDDPIRDKCFGTPGDFRGMKRFPYEGGHRVPGIVRFPGIIPAGIESNVLFNGTDILPTICNLVGEAVPSDRPIDGIDAFAAFLNKKVKRDVSSIWFYPNHEDTYFRMPQMSMRKGNYSLIGWLPPKADSISLHSWMANNNPEKVELYDLSLDPSQINDISIQNPEIVASMKKEMISLWQEMRDEGLAGKNNKK